MHRPVVQRRATANVERKGAALSSDRGGRSHRRRGSGPASLELPGYYPTGLVFRSETGGRFTEPTLAGYWGKVRARSRTGWDLYSASKHFGVWYMKVVLGLPDAAIAAQAGWSERSVAKMDETYGHAVYERRLGEIDAAVQTRTETQAAEIPRP